MQGQMRHLSCAVTAFGEVVFAEISHDGKSFYLGKRWDGSATPSLRHAACAATQRSAGFNGTVPRKGRCLDNLFPLGIKYDCQYLGILAADGYHAMASAGVVV